MNRSAGQAEARRPVEEYRRMPYTIQVIRDQADERPGLFARVIELPGCMTQADDFAELGEMIEDAMRAWIETALEDGQSIPEPWPIEAYSGKFVVRVPRSLHRQLTEAADRDGVSLNAFVNVALARAVGPETRPSISYEPRTLRPSSLEYSPSAAHYAQIAESQETDDQE